MIEWVILWSVKNRVFVLMACGVLVSFGLYALVKTPVDAIPDLSDVQVIIKTAYPGQAPQVVEDQVTYPLSTAMLSVPGATTVRGFSFFGDSYVYVIFDDNTDIYWARSRVLEYLRQAEPNLPAAAQPQLGPDATGVGWVYMYALVDPTGSHDIGQLRGIQDWFLKFELQAVEGVSEVASVGGMVKQYQVIVEPDKLRAYGIPLAHVQQAIQRSNREVGGSVIEMAEAEYMVRASGYIQGIEDLRQVPLGLSRNGIPIMLRDIAEITIGPQMRRGIAELNGVGETVGGIVVMRYGENAQATIRRVREKMQQLQSGLPDGVEVVTVYDRSALIENAVGYLWRTLGKELVLVGIICALFLFHLRSALVAVIALPVGILLAFVLIYLQGMNANIMSLGGLAIAIGTMIDGAIVCVENLHKHAERNPHADRWRQVTDASREVGPALFFSLLIITVSFLPVFALEAQEGRMFSPLAYTKTYAMAGAALLSITLVPVLIGYCIRGQIKSELDNPLNRYLVAGYRCVLNWMLQHPRWVTVGIVAVLASSYFPYQQIGSEFMPPLDEGDLMYMPSTYPGVSIGKARQILQQTDKLIRSVPEVKTVFGKVGRAETATDPAPLTMIETFIQFKPRETWRPGMTPEKLRRELDALVQLPGLTNAWVMPIKTRIDMLATGIKTPVGIKVAGPDLDTIEKIGRDLEDILKQLPQTASVYSERVAGGRYVEVNIRRETAARYGLNVEDIQQVIATAIGGTNVTYSVEGSERYPVNMRYPQAYRNSPEDMALLPIITHSGQRLSLGEVADIAIANGPPGIKSENARLNGWTYVDIQGIDIGNYVATAQSLVRQKLKLPPGYSIRWAGQFEYLQRTEDRLKVIVPVTLLVITFLLYANFRNMLDVMIILATLPFAVVGALWLLYLEGYNFSVAVAVGLIALGGIAAETGVIMLQYLKQACAGAQTADGYRQAVVEGACRRLRPVMMTSVATIVGLLPVMYGEGTGAQIMSRLAAPMVGGMLTVLLLVLIILPLVYHQGRQFGWLQSKEGA